MADDTFEIGTPSGGTATIDAETGDVISVSEPSDSGGDSGDDTATTSDSGEGSTTTSDPSRDVFEAPSGRGVTLAEAEDIATESEPEPDRRGQRDGRTAPRDVDQPSDTPEPTDETAGDEPSGDTTQPDSDGPSPDEPVTAEEVIKAAEERAARGEPGAGEPGLQQIGTPKAGDSPIIPAEDADDPVHDLTLGGTTEQRSALIADVLDQAGDEFTEDDIELFREGDQIVARIEDEAVRRERVEFLATQRTQAVEFFEEQLATGVETVPGTRRGAIVPGTDQGPIGEPFAGPGEIDQLPPIDIDLTEEDIELSDGVFTLTPAARRTVLSLQLEEFLRDRPMQPTPVDDQPVDSSSRVNRQQEQSREAIESDLERQLEAQIEAQTGREVDLDPNEDIDFETSDGEISATLSEEGRQKVEIESAPIVRAAEFIGFGTTEARAAAGAAAEFRQFGVSTRAEFVDPALQSLREATGLEAEIEQFEATRDELAAAEDDLLRPAVQFVRERSPRELALAAAPVAVAEPTPGGELVVGGLLATAAAAEAVSRLPPETQVAVGEAVATAASPGRRAQSFLFGEDPGAVSLRAEVPGLFPSEQELPAERDLFVSELPIEEQSQFLQELQIPAAPQSQFTAGRFTPPEVTVDTQEPTRPFGGPEVPVDTDEPGTAFGESELPVPETSEDFPQAEEIVGPAEAAPQQVQRRRPIDDPADVSRRRRRRTVPEEFIPDDGGFIGRGVGIGGGVIFRRGSTRSIDPQLIETPFADIDIAGLDPALARVLQEQELSSEDVFGETLAQAEVGARPRPEELTGIFGFTEERQNLASLNKQEQSLIEDLALDEDIAQRLRQSQLTVQAQRQAQRTAQLSRQAQATRLAQATPTAPAVATPTLFEPRVAEPTVVETVPAEATSPAELPIPGILPEADQPSRRRPRFDEFEKEFLEPVISPSEALGADDGGALDLDELAGDDT